MAVKAPPAGWYPKRGEVYLAQVEKGKARPALIVSVDALNRHALDVCVVPITSVQHKEFSMRVPIQAKDGGLHADSWAKCDQVTTLEKSFLQSSPLGVLSPSTLRRIEEQVRIALGLI